MRMSSGKTSPKTGQKEGRSAQKPRMPQRERGRARVAALMASAAQVFEEKGFEAATMTEIAARAGASIGTLYLFFPTKTAVARAILTETAEELSRRLEV